MLKIILALRIGSIISFDFKSIVSGAHFSHNEDARVPPNHGSKVPTYLSTSLHVFVTHRLVTWMLSPNQICLYYRKYILFSYAHVINFAFKLSAFFYCLPLCLSNFLVRANSLNCFFEQWSRYRWAFVIDPYFGIFCMLTKEFRWIV